VSINARAAWASGAACRVDWGTHEELFQGLLRVLLLAELGVDVAREVVREVFTHAQLLELATNLQELLEYVLVELLKMGLQRILVLRDRIPVRVVLLRRRKVLRARGGKGRW